MVIALEEEGGESDTRKRDCRIGEIKEQVRSGKLKGG